MHLSFPRSHGATTLKYLGMSFITGSVAHGFFSAERSLITAALGIIMFVTGSILEGGKSSLTILGYQAGLAIAIGIFTGGVQHFPDSPERSVWIVPLGILTSLFMLWKLEGGPWQRSHTVYALSSFALVVVSSLAAFSLLELGVVGGGHAH